ncbi:hypothetical protein [Amycolatopsis methanolica]|uniref:hypothetical protein n=1 Tax=Amycolatopsis methanolica TaxID=1814 RepID=UPI00342947A4
MLKLNHERFWWQIDDEDEQPEQWDVSADVTDLDVCPRDLRHVGDIALVIADLTRERNLLDSIVLGEWALEFIAETVIDPDQGRLHPELDAMIDDGPPRMVILRSVGVEPAWRGHGLGAALAAGALRILTPNARLAACRVSPLDFLKANDGNREAAELASLRTGAMLESIGFRRWRGVHVVDLKDPALVDARMDVLDQWWPEPDPDADAEKGNPQSDDRITVMLGSGDRPRLLKHELAGPDRGVREDARDDRIFLTVNLIGADPGVQDGFLADYQTVIARHEHVTHLKTTVLTAEPTFSLVLNAVAADHLVAKQVIDDLQELVRNHANERRDTMGTVIFTGSDTPWENRPS